MRNKIIIFIAILAVISGYFIYTDTQEKRSPIVVNIDDEGNLELIDPNIKDPGIDIPLLERELGELSDNTNTQLELLIERLEIDNLDIDAWVAIGNIWQVGDNYEAASEAWEYAYALDPLNEVSAVNLGNLYANYIGDLNKAESWYEKAIEAGPKYPVTYFKMAEMYLYKFDSRKKAIKVAKQGLKELPEDGSLQSLVDALEAGRDL